PHWLQSGDRFWYTYQTRDGRRFFVVDPLKKAKAPLFDHAKVAAQLTAVTRDAEIVSTKKRVGSEPDDEDDPQQGRGGAPGSAPRTPPRNRTLRFEYD